MILRCAPLSAQLQAIDVAEAGGQARLPERFRAKHALGPDPWVESGSRPENPSIQNPAIRFDLIETETALDRASAVQHKSSLKERARGAGRNASVGLGPSGMIVMVHAAGTLDLFSTIARTWPVTADPAERTVAVLPLNWAIRKRRTSF
jgi:hypothetical protein